MSDVIVKGSDAPAENPSVRERISAMMQDKIGDSIAKERGVPVSEPEDNETPENEEEEVGEPEPESTDEGEEESDEPKKKTSRAQERIQQLINERDAEKRRSDLMMQQLEMYKPLLDKALNPQGSVKSQEPTKLLPKEEYTSQEEYARAIVDVIGEVLNEKLNPITQKLATTEFQAKVDNWFVKNPEAAAVKGEMVKLADNLTPDEAAVFQKQIMNGNTFILEALQAKALASSKSKGTELLKDSIRADQRKAVSGASKKSTKTSKVQSRDSYAKALKGNPTAWLAEQFLQMEKRKD
jgi:hypothetical protein